jgi:hypothetical protein
MKVDFGTHICPQYIVDKVQDYLDRLLKEQLETSIAGLYVAGKLKDKKEIKYLTKRVKFQKEIIDKFNIEVLLKTTKK